MTSSSSKPKVPQMPKYLHGRDGRQFEIQKKVGAGCFGEVFRGINTQSKEEVAVKFEGADNQSPQLSQEAEVLNLLKVPAQPQGFAEFFYYGREGDFNCLVMEYLGKSLEDYVQVCGGRFTPKTACLVAQQVLMRIEYLHSRGLVHRDIKPENFMWGVKSKKHHLYLIDFGLSKKYFDKRHAQCSQRLSLTGTARYASINAHRGFEQSRRDDLEAIGHMLMYFLRSSLPWSGLDAKNKKEKYIKIKEKKESVPLPELCAGFPDAFRIYLEYARNLGFKDRPNYVYLRKLFADLKADMEKEAGRQIEAWEFEWFKGKELGELVPLLPYTDIAQPDDDQAAATRPRGMRCFFCGGSKVDD